MEEMKLSFGKELTEEETLNVRGGNAEDSNQGLMMGSVVGTTVGMTAMGLILLFGPEGKHESAPSKTKNAITEPTKSEDGVLRPNFIEVWTEEGMMTVDMDSLVDVDLGGSRSHRIDIDALSKTMGPEIQSNPLHL